MTEGEATHTQVYTMPRFASSSQKNKSRSIALLLDFMKRMPDRQSQVQWLQSFTMVGNSQDIQRRVQDHRMISHMGKTAKLWALMAFCLTYIAVDPQDVIVPVCKAWKLEHMNLGEVLVTIIAGSLVSRGGLNVHPAGTRSEKKRLPQREFDECRRLILSKPWYLENLRASVFAFGHLPKAEHVLPMRPDMGHLDQAARALEQTLRALFPVANACSKAVDQATLRLDDVQRRLDALDKLMEPGDDELHATLCFS